MADDAQHKAASVRVSLDEVIQECERNADGPDVFTAAIFDDAAHYLRQLSDQLAQAHANIDQLLAELKRV